MSNEEILQKLAALIRPRLSAANPLAESLFVELANAKTPEETRTCAVLQTSYSQARELIVGNFTWQYPCRLWARFYPPQGNWDVADLRTWFDEAALALVASLGALRGMEVEAQKAEGFVVLDAICTGGISWAAQAEEGWVGEVPFMLTVQF